MHLASKCGLKYAEKYSLRPDAPSGHFERLCKTRVETYKNAPSLYQFAAPGTTRDDVGVGEVIMYGAPPHEVIDDMLKSDASLMIQLEEAHAAHELPPCYDEHPIVKESGAGKVWPLGVLMDGVPILAGRQDHRGMGG